MEEQKENQVQLSGLELLDSDKKKSNEVKINQTEQNRRDNFSSIKFKQKVIDLVLQLSTENLVELKKKFEKDLFDLAESDSDQDKILKNKLKIKIETIKEILDKTNE